jgi:integrase
MKNSSLADRLLPAALKKSLGQLFDLHNDFRSDRTKGRCSSKTRLERRSVILLCFAQFWEMGYRLLKPDSLGERHVKLLAARWQKEGLVANTLHTRISNLSTFAEWIGKPGMVKRPNDYFPEEVAKRTHIAKENRAWDAHNVDPQSVIARARELDERFALYLSLQHQFGLRVKESLEFRPLQALVGHGIAFEIYEGTKGNRLRHIPAETPEQREVFEWAKAVAASSRSGRIRWPDCTFKQAQTRFYYLLGRKLHVNRRELGVTAHGLRHGYSQRKYRRYTGLPTPIEGGALGRIDRATHQAAGMQVSKALGHGRVPIVGSYYGSYGHALRVNKVTVTWAGMHASVQVADGQHSSAAEVQPATPDDETNQSDSSTLERRVP